MAGAAAGDVRIARGLNGPRGGPAARHDRRRGTTGGAARAAARPERRRDRAAEGAPPVCAEGRLGGRSYLGQWTCGFHIESTPAGLFFQIQTCCE
jgi:hypothetical protein